VDKAKFYLLTYKFIVLIKVTVYNQPSSLVRLGIRVRKL